jgi:hypothetical protein
MTGRDGTRAAARFFGWLIMAAGGLIALTTGACTLYVLAGLMTDGTGGYGTTGEWVLLALVIGGLPCLIGVGLFFGGRKLSRPSRARKAAVPENDDASNRRP